MRRPIVRTAIVTAVLVGALAAPFGGQSNAPTILGGRALVHAHNCYPEGGQWSDRITRALALPQTPIVIEQDTEAGGYVVYCPTLKGCVSQGETEEEALDNIKDAIKTYLESTEDLKRSKKLRTVEVTV